jgi:hypothetical protein
MRWIVLLTLSVVLCKCVSAGQDVSKDSIVNKLRQVRTHISTLKTSSAPVKNKVKDNLLLINDIIRQLRPFTRNYPAEYNIALNSLVQISQTLKDQDSTTQLNILTIMHRDISLKFTPKPNQLGDQLFAELTAVKVVTLRQGREVKHLRVRYCPLGFQVDFKQPGNSFQRLSSPVTEDMVPGYYLIWVTVDGNYDVLQSWKGEIHPLKSNVIEINIQ